ncbi:hypothetical protein V8C86DRAFT_2542672 [Haematococcus lacustris]
MSRSCLLFVTALQAMWASIAAWSCGWQQLRSRRAIRCTPSGWCTAGSMSYTTQSATCARPTAAVPKCSEKATTASFAGCWSMCPLTSRSTPSRRHCKWSWRA